MMPDGMMKIRSGVLLGSGFKGYRISGSRVEDYELGLLWSVRILGLQDFRI